MDRQAPSSTASGAAAAPAFAIPAARRRDTPLGRAQPVMGQPEPGPHPVATEPVPLPGGVSLNDEPRIRRRASSGGPASPAGSDGWYELAAFRRIAESVRRHRDSGASESEKEMRSLGCDRDLIDQLVGRHQASRRAERVLAGGARPSQAQQVQAFALCVFDTNRWMSDRAILGIVEEGDGDAAHAVLAQRSAAALARLVQGAKRLAAFEGLKPAIDLWARLRLDPHGSDWNVMRLTLVSHTGLFETNARRLLEAFAAAMAMRAPLPLDRSATSAPADDADFTERLRVSLLRQWLTGPGEQERELLDSLSCDDAELFHRRLTQQFALLCRHFGQPLPPMSELILVDDPD